MPHAQEQAAAFASAVAAHGERTILVARTEDDAARARALASPGHRRPHVLPSLDWRQIETLLSGALGLSTILWLGEGLVDDHTDGHVDNLARFVAPGVLVVPQATTGNDPNAAIFADAAARARAFGLDVALIPSVDLYEIDGKIAPASYMNFTITNGAVIVPQYGSPNDAAALDALGTVCIQRSHIMAHAR